MKVVVIKSPGNAEQIQVETEWNGSAEGWRETVEPVLGQLDRRMAEHGVRVLRGAQLSRSADPAAAQVARQILEMVNGVDLSAAVEKLEAAGIEA